MADEIVVVGFPDALTCDAAKRFETHGACINVTPITRPPKQPLPPESPAPAAPPPQSVPEPAPTPAPPPEVEPPVPDPLEPLDDLPPDIVVSAPKYEAPDAGAYPLTGLVYGFDPRSGAQPRPQPRRRPVRRPRRAPPPKRTPRRAPRTTPRVRPAPTPTPLGRLATLARGALSRVFGGVFGVLYPSTFGDEPPSGDPIYGGFYGDQDNDPTYDLPGVRGLPGVGDELEVRARPIRPRPFVPAPLPTPLFRTFPEPGLFGLPLDGTTAPRPRPEPIPTPAPSPRPIAQPTPNPGLGLDPLPIAAPAPLPRPAPSPRPAPRPSPRVPTFPTPFAPPFGATPGPGVLTLPKPQPVPKPELAKCKPCNKQKKEKKKKKPRAVCYRGTYVELSSGLIKHRKEQITCR